MMPMDSDLTSNRSNVSCSVHSLPPAAPLPCNANYHIRGDPNSQRFDAFGRRSLIRLPISQSNIRGVL